MRLLGDDGPEGRKRLSWIVASPASGASPLAPGASVTVSLTLGAGLSAEAAHQGSIALVDDGLASEVALSVQVTTRAMTGQSTLYAGTNKLNIGDNSSWIALGGGVSGGDVLALAMDDRREFLYVGGSFTSAGGVSGTRGLSKWDGTTWSTVGGGLVADGGSTNFYGTVNALAIDLSTGTPIDCMERARRRGIIVIVRRLDDCICIRFRRVHWIRVCWGLFHLSGGRERHQRGGQVGHRLIHLERHDRRVVRLAE